VGKFFAISLAIITIVSAGIFVSRIWWLPVDVSVHGAGIDHQLIETLIASGVLFVVSQLSLAFFVWRYAERNDGRQVKTFPGGVKPMVIGAVVLVGIEILTLTLVGSKLWAGIYIDPAEAGALQIDVQASQFAFYFRYPGADGKFGALHVDKISEADNNYFGLDPANDTAARDDIVAATLTIPVNTPIALTMHSKDVSHALFIPDLRIQQDFVPGLNIPVHFTATTVGRHEIVCTQLCGLGHYNMRAYVEIVTKEQYAQWLKDQAAQQ
jgi:cytochrome c oxidase subunit 2